MAVMKIQAVAGVSADFYDQQAVAVADALRQAPGFLAHFGYVQDDGVCVAEVWRSREDHDNWYATVVRAAVPAGTPEPELFEVRHASTDLAGLGALFESLAPSESPA
jgi:heme-degrading monooxygenase HmoA